MIAYSERQRQILRLARIFHSVPNPHNHLPHIFSLSLSLLRLFFVIATRWKEEREEEDVDDDEAPSARRL